MYLFYLGTCSMTLTVCVCVPRPNIHVTPSPCTLIPKKYVKGQSVW